MGFFNRKIGGFGEDIAEAFLKKKGYRILATNFYTPYGELDIIALENETLAFIEVKTRRTMKYDVPFASITEQKQKKIVRSALFYLSSCDITFDEYRFDAVSITFSRSGQCPNIEIIRNAFEAGEQVIL
ncbi:MAG: YraN family protein [Candidatus Auribacterota bacterium]